MTTLTKHLKVIIPILLIIFTSISCQKEALMMTTDKEYPEVNAELWIYFQRFEEAAAKRGMPIDLIESGITGSIEALEITNVVGLCRSNAKSSHIVIDEIFWKRSGSMRRELAIFHELGHCYLKLGHTDETHADGRCKSIMRSGFSGCIDMYTHESRGEYQDELFK